MAIDFIEGAPCWVELSTHDPDGATKFYGELFGWTATKSSPEYGGYFILEHQGQPIAGCMPNNGTMGPSAWSVYLKTSDITETVRRAEAGGATVLSGPMQVGDAGHMANVVDPGGASVGIWQPHTLQGFSAVGEVGTPAWFEVLSTDYDATVPFYRDVFRWDTQVMSDTTDFRYTTHGPFEDSVAGIMDAREMLGDQPSHWQFYVTVADTDATVEQAVAAGGTLLMPVDDTPYGRLGALADPAGLPFHVMQPPAS